MKDKSDPTPRWGEWEPDLLNAIRTGQCNTESLSGIKCNMYSNKEILYL